MLESLFEVEIAGSLESALTKLSSGLPFAGVLLDVTLPNSEGYETVERLQAAHPELAIVAMSGYDFDSGIMITKGAQAFLKKPDDFRSHSLVLKTVLDAIKRHVVRGRFAPSDAVLKEIKETVGAAKDELDGNRMLPSSSAVALQRKTSE